MEDLVLDMAELDTESDQFLRYYPATPLELSKQLRAAEKVLRL